VIQQLADDGTPCGAAEEYREITKLESTYIDALPPVRASEDHPVHTCLRRRIAATVACHRRMPNLQNIPSVESWAATFGVDSFPRPGWTLLAADYSQIGCDSSRIYRMIRGPFVQAFRSGGDIHVQTAALIFDVPLDAVTRTCGAARRRSLPRRFTVRTARHSLSNSRSRMPRRRSSSRKYFERFIAFANI